MKLLNLQSALIHLKMAGGFLSDSVSTATIPNQCHRRLLEVTLSRCMATQWTLSRKSYRFVERHWRQVRSSFAGWGVRTNPLHKFRSDIWALTSVYAYLQGENDSVTLIEESFGRSTLSEYSCTK